MSDIAVRETMYCLTCANTNRRLKSYVPASIAACITRENCLCALDEIGGFVPTTVTERSVRV